ncbi:carboxymuconolactone decarboxylase family protein [Georgenia sp. AZ-5]|uniref:carboxymuconolactone decarboxylase family protein n=1 Tax=Georgenia sp. AZ-5 TaxID=3367526 RepID=UPI00375436E1
MPINEIENTTGTAADLLGQVQRGMGAVPNMAKAMVNSPATLKGYLRLSAALGGGKLDAITREKIALTVAQANECSYCLSVHTAKAPSVGISEDEVLAARRASSGDPKTDAILKLAAAIVATRGAVTDEQVQAARAAGITPEEATEVVGNVALNTLTNFFNKAAQVDIDFPVVDPADI